MSGHIQEAGRTIPVVAAYDVIVCGGGPAGISAALTAARSGARTLLLELGGCLGGIWTAGLLSLVLDTGGKAGLLRELIDRLESYALVNAERGRFTYDAEAMKYVLEQLCREAGVTVRLHTRIVGAAMRGRTIAAAITESASGREAFAAHTFVDCTGNGDFAAQAGCRFERGHPDTGKTQPATLFALISGVPPGQGETYSREQKAAFRELLRAVDADPSYQDPSLFYLPHPGLFCLMINHEYDVRCDSADDITAATMHARAELFRAVHALRRLDGWQDARLVTTAEHIGIREGRRVAGAYRLTVDDLVAGRRFDDGVCLVRFGVDVHALQRSDRIGANNLGMRIAPYHVPMRSLIAADCDNLLLAGRLISGDFLAHSSYRVTGNAVPMGEAAGYGAALAARDGLHAGELNGAAIRARMQAAGYEL